MTMERRDRQCVLTRRRVLASLAASLCGAPLLRSLASAAAEPAAGLEGLIGVYMPHGIAKELYRPAPGFDISYQNSVLAPFDDPASGTRLRERILVIEGLDLTAGIRGGSAGHSGARALFTGGAFEAHNASIDQYLAVERGFGSVTPLPSLVLGVGHPELDIGACVSYAAGGIQLPKIVDPSRAFAEAIGRWVVGGDAAQQAEAARERQLGKSVLDVLRTDLSRLQARVGAAERAKLDQHADALRVLERRLGGFELACSVPVAPDPAAFPAVLAYQGGEPYFDVISDLQVDVLASAFACGVTRFATLYLADLSYTGYDPVLPADVHTDVAHRYVASADDGSSPGVPESWALLGRQNRYAFSKVARLARKLEEAGLLDTTLVVASSDMGDPARHSSRGVPTLLAGGSAAGIQLGRYLDVRSAGLGVPNNRLLVAICRAFGLELDTFGEASDPSITSGALDLG